MPVIQNVSNKKRDEIEKNKEADKKVTATSSLQLLVLWRLCLSDVLCMQVALEHHKAYFGILIAHTLSHRCEFPESLSWL